MGGHPYWVVLMQKTGDVDKVIAGPELVIASDEATAKMKATLARATDIKKVGEESAYVVVRPF